MTIESRPRGEIHSLQALRALAACLIALGHLDNYAVPVYLTKGFSWIGVDIFFVLSGFIVAYTIQPYMHERRAWLLFLKKRAARIFPFYWVACVLALVVAALTGYKAGLPSDQLIASFTLFPQKIGEQLIPVAWTLNYEWLFYGVSALILFCRRGTIFSRLCILWLIAIFIAQPWATLEPRPYFSWAMYFGSLYQFEFLCGIAAGYAYLGKLKLPQFTNRALFTLGLLCLMSICAALYWGYGAVEHPQKFGHYTVFAQRCVLLGITVGFIIFALAELERRNALPAMPAWLLKLGGASYVLYLLHDLIYVALGTLWQQAMGALPIQSGAWQMVAFCVIAWGVTVAVSLFATRFIEQPLTRKAKKVLGA